MVIATMVVVDEVHGANENFKKCGKRRRAVPEQVIAAVRATTFHVEHGRAESPDMDADPAASGVPYVPRGTPPRPITRHGDGSDRSTAPMFHVEHHHAESPHADADPTDAPPELFHVEQPRLRDTPYIR